jgi:hypothetical protein
MTDARLQRLHTRQLGGKSQLIIQMQLEKTITGLSAGLLPAALAFLPF